MNWIHVHLALNHLPVLGTPFVLLLLATGMIRRSDEIQRLALVWLLVLAVVSIAIKFTGDMAFDVARTEPWMEPTFVSAHEQAADQATTGVFVMGVAAAACVWRGRRGGDLPRWLLITTLLLAVATTLLLMRTANSGGQIRHPEIRVQSGFSN